MPLNWLCKNHKVDAAADDVITYNQMKAHGLISDKDVKIIYTSDPIPGSPWAWRKDLPSELKDKLKDAFLNVAKEIPRHSVLMVVLWKDMQKLMMPIITLFGKQPKY